MKSNFKIKEKSLLLLILYLLLVSCKSNTRSSRMYLYSKDRSHIITVISDYETNKRIIAIGKVTNQPKKNYVQLDISEVTELADEIGVCWFDIGGWQIVNDKSKIVRVDMDTTKYVIKTKWNNDKEGMPTPAYYKKENCYTVGALSYSKIHPNDNGHVERQ